MTDPSTHPSNYTHSPHTPHQHTTLPPQFTYLQFDVPPLEGRELLLGRRQLVGQLLVLGLHLSRDGWRGGCWLGEAGWYSMGCGCACVGGWVGGGVWLTVASSSCSACSWGLGREGRACVVVQASKETQSFVRVWPANNTTTHQAINQSINQSSPACVYIRAHPLATHLGEPRLELLELRLG